MRVISPKTLRAFWTSHAQAQVPLRDWLRVVEQTDWESIQHLRRTYPHADAVWVKSGRTATVFNIGAGKYRLIAAIHYNTKRVYVLRVLTHAEYDKDTWKDRL